MRIKILAVLAFLIFVPAVFPAAVFAGFDEGRMAYDKKDWKNAILNLRPAAESGDDRAMILLANMYSDGNGVEKDLKESFSLYRRAAIKNNAAGIIATATMYQQGMGVDANNKLGIEWLERSAKLGHQSGAFFYGVALYQGSKGKTYDVKADHPGAYKWFRIAAKNDTNENLKKAAAQLADTLAKQLTGNEITTADREVLEWKPVTAEALGPLPEEKAKAAEAQEKPAAEKPAEKEIAKEPAKESAPVKPAAPQ